MQPLYLTHYAIATSLGAGLDATFARLSAGQTGLAPQTYPGELATWTGRIEAIDASPLDASLSGFECRNNRLAAIALAQDGFMDAIADLRERHGPDRIGVFLGTSTSGIESTENAYRQRTAVGAPLAADFRYAETHNIYSLGRLMHRLLGMSGPSVVASAACATTAKTFGNAARMIEAGFCDAAVVGGADTLCATTIYGFHSLGLVSPTACRPFDKTRDGISIGEGAGFAIVEKAPPAALPPGAVILRGFGESSDAYHMSTPHPEGKGAQLAMERALASAGLQPKDIDYINVHGTATQVGDAAEDRALVELFGKDKPCSSTKGFTGHTLASAGIVEAIIAALAIEHNFMPGTANTEEFDPALQSRYLLRGERGPVRRVLSNSFGFGGSNCSLVLERPS
ncbi:MAG TPA: beta-ketoacyl-[acyl-carrier-protein] synthase family protein [Stellaceae bacterium]|jgi:3-oxoacyl-[acyl-carrier-protein] synthase-1|nr:beta-ketoacyl-[acyl-carrier-protein] synthase family protein [Stellaceae bacterium]